MVKQGVVSMPGDQHGAPSNVTEAQTESFSFQGDECSDLHWPIRQEPHKQVGVGSIVTSGSLGGDMVSILAQNAWDVGSIPAFGTIFPIFITPTTLVAVPMTLHKLHIVWLLNLPYMLYVRSLPVHV